MLVCSCTWMYTLYTLNLVRPGREQQESNYDVDTIQVYTNIIFIFIFSRKNTYY